MEKVSDHGTIWSRKTPHSEKIFELEKEVKNTVDD